MHAFLSSKRKLLLALFGGAALAACSTTDRTVTGLRAPGNGTRDVVDGGGNITICKVAGPAGTYHFHVDVAGPGHYAFTGNSPDNDITFDGTNPSCWNQAFIVNPDGSWTASTTDVVTITETVNPTFTVDSVQVFDGFGNHTTVKNNPVVVVVEGIVDFHTVLYYNASVPQLTCVAIVGAVEGVPITPVTVTATGGTGGNKYTSSDLAGLGLAIDLNTGQITGTPNFNGSRTYHITVTDKDGHTSTLSCTVTVAPPLALTCVAIVGAVQGVPITPVTVTATGGTGGYKYTSSDLAGFGLAIDLNTGQITGTPNFNGSRTYHITVTDQDGHTSTFSCTVDVAPPPLALTCVAIVGAVQGVPITPVTVTATGGTGGYKYTSVDLGGFGLAIDLNSGQITGTPNFNGSRTYHITVTDQDGHTSTFFCTVTVTPPPLALTCVAIVGAVQGVPITPVTVTATGGTGGYKYTSSDLAGLGLAIDLNTGQITGTPNFNGSRTYHITVTDQDGHTSTFSCTVTVAPPPLALTCVAIVGAVQGVPITPVTVTATGGTGGYKYTSSDLAGFGLAIDLNTGQITGTPNFNGSRTYHITVTDQDGHTSTFSCTVTVAPPPLALTCVAIVGAVQGVPITPVTVTATGGTGGYKYTSVDLGGFGLAIDLNSGQITGTPNFNGSRTYHITVTDQDGHTSTFYCTVTVTPPPLALTCVAIVGAVQGVPIAPVTVTATGGTGGYKYTSSDLAGLGLAIDLNTGQITGTPNFNGSLTYHITVTDQDGHTSTFSCTVTVAPPPLALTCVAIVGAVQGVPITPVTVTATGGTGGYKYTSSDLAGFGLAIDLNSGQITGTPNFNGSRTYHITVTDQDGHTSTFSCTVTVAPPPLALTCVAIVGAVQGVPIAPVTVTATGGTGGYKYTSSDLAGLGLAIDLNSGQITGTPNFNGSRTYHITVTDQDGHTSTFSCTVTVAPPPLALTCAAIVGAVQGVPIAPVTVTATGGTGGYKYTSSDLAGLGLAIDLNTGQITGTPNFNGSRTYHITVTDQDGHTSTFSCTVTVAPPPLALTCAAIVGAVQGVPIAPVTVTATGGTGGYKYTSSDLAGLGLAIDLNTGQITGTPNFNGSKTYHITVTDSAGNTTTFSCTISVLTKPAATCGVLTNVKQGVPITPVTVTGSGGAGSPYTFSSPNLPSGLSISPTGTISGTPNVSGTNILYTIIVKDKNGNTGSTDCYVTISTGSANGFLTETMGGWGADPHGGNPGALLAANFTKVFGVGGSVSIGTTNKLIFTSAGAINAFLPCTTTPVVLPHGVFTNPTGALGTLAGQTLALTLSVAFSNAGVTKVGLGSLHLVSGKLAGYSISQVLTLANGVLGGTASLPSGMSVSDLTDILDKLNMNYDDGTKNGGYVGP